MTATEKAFIAAAKRYCAGWLAGHENLSRLEMIKEYLMLRDKEYPRKPSKVGLGIIGFIVALAFAAPTFAQQPSPPSDTELTQRRITALSAELQYMQKLAERLSADGAAAEARAKWAVAKLWQVPEEDIK